MDNIFQQDLTVLDLFKGDLQLTSPPSVYFQLQKVIENPNKIQIIQGIAINNKQIIINDKSFFDFLLEAIEDFFEKLLIEMDIKIKFR